MNEMSSNAFLKWMSIAFLALVVVAMVLILFDTFPAARCYLAAFAACMFVSSIVMASMYKDLIVKMMELEDKELNRQSEERKRNSDLTRSEKEAERIRAAESRITVITVKSDE